MIRAVLLSLVLCFMFSKNCDAQFTRGQRIVGASIFTASLNSGESDYSFPAPTAGYHSKTNSAGFNLAPSIAWFITEALAVGGRLNAGYRHERASDDDYTVTFRKRTTNDFTGTLGFFARNYFGKAGGFIPFAQVNVDGGISNEKIEGFNYTTTYKETYTGKSSGDFTFTASLSVGVTRMISEQIGLDLFAGYAYTHQKNKFKTTSLRDVGFDGTTDETVISEPETKFSNHGLQLGVGLQIFLARK